MRICLIILLFIPYKVTGEFHLNCDTNPCQYGTCVNLYRKTAYRCDCDLNWEGENCDKEVLIENPSNEEPKQSVVTKPKPSSYDSKCFSECLNDGTCDKRTGLCVCKRGFSGKNCEIPYKRPSKNEILSSIELCHHECSINSIKTGKFCRYNYLDSTETCQCVFDPSKFSMNKEKNNEKVCSRVIKRYSICQSMCQHHLSHHRNPGDNLPNTRVCRFFNSTTEQTIEACTCVNSKDWCERTSGFDFSWIRSILNIGGIVGLFFAFNYIQQKCRERRNQRGII